MVAISVEKIVADFLHKSFPVINDKPEYQSINNIWTLLCDNEYILTMGLGGVNHGHIGVVMQDMIYATISPIPYVMPL